MKKPPRNFAPYENASVVDPRPQCITCGHRWLPTEGVDATRVPCCRCLGVFEREQFSGRDLARAYLAGHKAALAHVRQEVLVALTRVEMGVKR